MMVKSLHKRKEQIWAYICRNHHPIVEATNEKCETHYANLQRLTSFVLSLLFCLYFLMLIVLSVTELFKPRARMDAALCESERILHENKQKELQQLITHGHVALQTLWDREVVAWSERQAPADEERAAAHKAAAEQKQARKEREQKRQQLVCSFFGLVLIAHSHAFVRACALPLP